MSRSVCKFDIEESMTAADQISADFRKIFMPQLEEIEELMKEQLELARQAGHKVQV